MDFEFDNPIIWAITGFASFVIWVSIWKFGGSIGWDRIPMTTRVLISILTPPIAFLVATMTANKGN